MNGINCMKYEQHRVASGNPFLAKGQKIMIMAESQLMAEDKNVEIYTEKPPRRVKNYGEIDERFPY